MSKLTGITFNNRSSEQFNVGWRTLSKPTSPTPKESTYSPSAMDGEYDFSSFNPDNRPHYEPIEITGQFILIGKDILSVEEKVFELQKWLKSAKGKPADLYFNARPNRIYSARVVSTSDITEYEHDKNVLMTVVFKCHPYPKSKDVVMYGSTSSSSNVYFNDMGSFYTKPKITISGSFSKITITSADTGRSIEYTGAGSTGVTLIDFNTESVTVNGKFYNELVVGDFWELDPYSPTNNQMTISVSGGSISYTIEYPRLELF